MTGRINKKENQWGDTRLRINERQLSKIIKI